MPTLIDRGPAEPLQSLYVHVPMCRDRCTYCAFATVADDATLHEPVTSALIRELDRSGCDPAWRTVYLGGGTPGLLHPAQLERLLGRILRHSEPIELTLEANPLNIEPESLRFWSELGVTRLSVGVQTLQDDALRSMGRHHDGRQALEALDLVAEAWPGTWSADLLLGWPDTTSAQLERDLDALLGRQPDHLSIYGLELEPGTPAHKTLSKHPQVEFLKHALPPLGQSIAPVAGNAGLERYEVSNFARPGAESQHNQAYWANDEYLGLGPGACSSSGPLRWKNQPDTRRWLEAIEADSSARVTAERLSPSDRLLESLAVGLRMRLGLELAELEHRFGPTWRVPLDAHLAELEPYGLRLGKDRLAVTEDARDHLDALLRLLAAHWPSEPERSP